MRAEGVLVLKLNPNSKTSSFVFQRSRQETVAKKGQEKNKDGETQDWLTVDNSDDEENSSGRQGIKQNQVRNEETKM